MADVMDKSNNNNEPVIKKEYKEESNEIEAADVYFSSEKENSSVINTEKVLFSEENFIIADAILKEEESCAQENKEENNVYQQQLQERAKEEKEEAEKRHKMLMHLLGKSEFYSKYLLQKIEDQTKSSNTKKPKKKKVTVDKENSQNASNSSQENSSNSQDGKGNKRPKSSNVLPRKRRRCSKYAIGDIIDKETVEDALTKEQEEEEIIRESQPLLLENGVMRNYQLDGYSWLKVLYENGINGILADEMGLGKTIQCIAIISYLIEMKVPGPFLVLGPLSTLPNWLAEFERFSPKIPTLLYHGTLEERQAKLRKISRGVDVPGIGRKICPVVITSYDVLIRDTKALSTFNWKYLAVDEGHRLKNHECRLAKCLRLFNTSNRLILTGTPLQNSLAELWSLMNFLLPDIFDSLEIFESWFNISDMMENGSEEKIIQQEREQQVISTLHKILTPFLLRRTKADVAIEIPPKKERLVYSPMTPLQLKLYEATIQKDLVTLGVVEEENTEVTFNENGRKKRKCKSIVDFKALFDDNESDEALDKYIEAALKTQLLKEQGALKEQSKMARNVKLQNRMMQCRKVVNHPFLLQYPVDKDGFCVINEDLVKVCGKLLVLDQLLKELKSRGHKVLIFSQMTKLLDIIEDFLHLRPQYNYKRLDGSTHLDDRRKDIYEFNNDPNCFLYLISTRAGSLGINLTAADTAIIYDSDWNPQQDLQAQDRCHRIGQTKPVLVLRLITAGSIDERIVQRAAAKRKLEKMIIKSGTFKSSALKENKEDKIVNLDVLREMLQQTDYERIHRTKTGEVFDAKELDALLDRSDMMQDSDDKEKTKLAGVFEEA